MPRSLQVLWTSHRGRTWDLTDLRSTVQLVGLDGLGTPTFSQQFAESGARDGRRYEGTNYRQGEITLTVSVGDIMPLPGRKYRRVRDEWRPLDQAWRKSLSPEEAGTLTVITASGGKRMLKLRLAQPAIVPAQQDPSIIGEATYAHMLTADDQPWWEGDDVPALFNPGTASRGFFSGGSGNRLYISESARIGDATITNVGDRAVHPKWWARGPFTSAAVGVGNELVSIPFPRGPKQYIYIDSGRETITDENGNSLWPLMGFSDPTFSAIQPGDSVKLFTALENSTSGDANDPESGSAIGLSITPIFEGPW